MKDVSAAMLAHLAQATTTLATCWKVIRTDGSIFGWTDHDKDIIIAGVTYRASEGLSPTTAHSTDDFSVDTLDVTVFLDVTTEIQIAAGIWDDAIVTVFEVNWASPPAMFTNDLLVIRHGTLGQIQRQNNQMQVEIRGLAQRLAKRIGRAYSPTCPWRTGLWDVASQTYISSVECGLILAAFIFTGTITSLGSDPLLDMNDTAQAQADGYFAEGLLTFTTGTNANISREIRHWSNKQFALYRPFPYAVVVGHAYKALAGDDHTKDTCKNKFSNLANFGGFSFIPGIANVFSNPAGL